MKNQLKEKVWIDESGIAIPANRISKAEKIKERAAATLLKEAQHANAILTSLKHRFKELSQQAYEAAISELEGVEAGKGNFTWYNFDRSVKIEVNINEQIAFDDILIQAAKQKLDEFISEHTGSVDEMIRGIILHAFETSKGRLDTKRIMSLIAHSTRVDEKKYPAFHEAIRLVQKAIHKPSSRTYYRISLRDSNGDYQAIELNFSAIKTA